MGLLSPQHIARLQATDHEIRARKAESASRIVELGLLLLHRKKWREHGALGVSAHHGVRALQLAFKLPADLQEGWASLSSWELAAVLAESTAGHLAALNALPEAELRLRLQGSPDSMRRQLDAITPLEETPMSSKKNSSRPWRPRPPSRAVTAPKPVEVTGETDRAGRAVNPTAPQLVEGLCRWPGCGSEPNGHRGMCKACYTRSIRKGLRDTLALPAQAPFAAVNGSTPTPTPTPVPAPEPELPKRQQKAQSGTYTFPEPDPNLSPIVVLVDVDGYEERLLELDVQGRWVDTQTGEPPDYRIRVWSSKAADKMPGSPARRELLDAAWEAGQLMPREVEVFEFAALQVRVPLAMRGRVKEFLEEHPGLIQVVDAQPSDSRPELMRLRTTDRGQELAERWGLTTESVRAENLQLRDQLNALQEKAGALEKKREALKAALTAANEALTWARADIANVKDLLHKHGVDVFADDFDLETAAEDLLNLRVDSHAELAAIKQLFDRNEIGFQSPAEGVAMVIRAHNELVDQLVDARQEAAVANAKLEGAPTPGSMDVPSSQAAIEALFAYLHGAEFFCDTRAAMLFAAAFPELTLQRLTQAAA